MASVIHRHHWNLSVLMCKVYISIFLARHIGKLPSKIICIVIVEMSKPKPVDKNLYDEVKSYIYHKYPQHSAYRSGLLVKAYKSEFTKKHGNIEPYTNPKPRTTGLKRWFDEEWVNQNGTIGYEKKGDIYRPSKRITQNTPVTWSELTPREIKKAQEEKAKTGHVKRFK